MSHKHEHLLETIFKDPINTNIHWREIESLLKHLGAQIEPASAGGIKVRLGRAEAVLHRPHHGATLDRHAVRDLRQLLGNGGATPSMYRESHRKPG